jgi:hypothetical protein
MFILTDAEKKKVVTICGHLAKLYFHLPRNPADR